MKNFDLVLIEAGKTMQDLDAKFDCLMLRAMDLESAKSKAYEIATRLKMVACVLTESR
jgi:hypothetical protein